MSSSRWFCGWFVYRVGGSFYATRGGVRLKANTRFGINRSIVRQKAEAA